MSLIHPDNLQPVVVHSADAELLGTAPNTIQLLADGGTTGGVLSAVRSRMSKGTDGPAPHYHAAQPELFFIIEGRLNVLVGERVVTVGEGDFLLVPPHMPHAFSTPEDSGVDLLFLMPTVDRFEYFRLVDQVRQGKASPREILDSQDRFDNHFLDSPVWRQFRSGTP
jgi:quercetin dioxygenase-like cupin family protein